MTDRPSKAGSGDRKRLSLLVALTLLLVPVSSWAESSNLLIIAEAKPDFVPLAAPITRQLIKQEAVDKFMVRYGDVSFSLDYGACESTDPIRERSGLQSPVKTAAGLSNLTVKVGFAF